MGSISYGAALFFTALILKPLDIILDKIYKKPKGPRSLCLSPGEGGVRYILTQDKKFSETVLSPGSYGAHRYLLRQMKYT